MVQMRRMHAGSGAVLRMVKVPAEGGCGMDEMVLYVEVARRSDL